MLEETKLKISKSLTGHIVSNETRLKISKSRTGTHLKIDRNKTAKKSWDYDKKINEILSKSGYIVIRFWESEINNNLEYCVNKIKELIKL